MLWFRLKPTGRFGGALAFGLLATTLFASSDVGIAIIRTTKWSGETRREGAAEFAVLLQAARLRKTSRVAGLVTVGNRHGMMAAGGERALRRLALSGIAVVRIAPGGSVASSPDQLYLDGSGLEESAAEQVLCRGLELHGPPPAARDPENPSAAELAAIRTHLDRLQRMFEPPAVAIALR